LWNGSRMPPARRQTACRSEHPTDQGAAGTTATVPSASGSSEVSKLLFVSDWTWAMPATNSSSVSRLVNRRPDPDDRRRALVELTPAGRETLEDDRGRRVGWLVSAIEELPPREQAVLARATAIIGRLAERSD
jgi:hypothetical protein